MAIKKSQSEKNAADTSVINPINEDGEQDGKTDAADSEEKAPPKKKTKKRGLDVSNLDEQNNSQLGIVPRKKTKRRRQKASGSNK